MQRRETLTLALQAATEDALAQRMLSCETSPSPSPQASAPTAPGLAVVNVVLVRPQPYPKPERIVSITTAANCADTASAP